MGDGGIVRRTTPLSSQGNWVSITGNLQITEQHDIAFDAVSRRLVSGNQDTGTVRQTVLCGTAGNPPCTTWTADRGAGPGQLADGGDVVIDDITLAGAATPGSIYYTSAQFLGSFLRSTVLSNGVAPTATAVALCPNGTVPVGSCVAPAPVVPQFYSPLALHTTNRQRLVVVGQQAIWESFTQGGNVQNVGAAANANAVAYGHPQNANLLVATVAAGQVLVRTSATGSGTPDANLAAIPLPVAGFVPIDVTIDPAAGAGNVVFYVLGLSVAGVPQVFSFTITSAAGTAVAGNWTNLSGDLAAVNPGFPRRIVHVN